MLASGTPVLLALVRAFARGRRFALYGTRCKNPVPAQMKQWRWSVTASWPSSHSTSPVGLTHWWQGTAAASAASVGWAHAVPVLPYPGQRSVLRLAACGSNPLQMGHNTCDGLGGVSKNCCAQRCSAAVSCA